MNGAAATLLTGAVAAGLTLFLQQVHSRQRIMMFSPRVSDETQEEMTEQEPQTEANAELVSAERYQAWHAVGTW